MAVRSPYGRRSVGAGTVIAAIFGFIAFIIVLAIYNAFVFKTLFNWFVVPHFGVAPIGYAMAFGLTALVGLLVARPTSSDDDPNGFSALAGSVGYSTMALIIGWFAQASL